MKGILLFPLILLKSIYFRFLADKTKPLSKPIEKYGRKLAIKNFSFHQFVNPISSVIYYEFDFCNTFINPQAEDEILDISSPYLFGSFINSKNNINYTYINPDLKDLIKVKKKL